MKSITVYTVGRADAEDGKETPNSRAVADSIRVRVRYAGVGFADVMAVRGRYHLAPKRPFTPGYEFLGTVESVRASKRPPGLAQGTRVVGMLGKMGAYREFIDVDPRLIAPVPEGVSDQEAALLPLNYLTAYAMIERLAGLSAGMSFLIHGAAGGVGTATLELARVLGLRAFGTASKTKHDLVRSLGGVPLDRENDAWMGELMQREPHGMDAAFDSFGVASMRKSWRVLSPKGTLVCYGLSPSINAGTGDFVKGAMYLGFRKVFGGGKRVITCGTPGIVEADPAWFRTAMERILQWAAAGAFKPVLAGVFPWHKVGEAHQELVEGRVKGKLLLDFAC